jgi:two-component system chemotaxis sensor kinase CheA
MDKKEEEFLKRIQATFLIEAEEHVRAFSSGLIELEKIHPDGKVDEITEILFREIHSLKGAARSVDHKDAESVCQPLESVFSALKNKKIKLSPDLLGLFYKTSDLLTKVLLNTSGTHSGDDRKIMRELITQLKESAEPNLHESTTAVEKIPDLQPAISEKLTSPESNSSSDILPPSRESVRIRISKLDPLLLQAEELLQTKIAISQRAIELEEIRTNIGSWIQETQKWRSQRSGASSERWNEWMEENDLHLNDLENRLTSLAGHTQKDQHNLSNMVDNHLDSMKQILMLPVSSLVEIFPLMVREIAREQNKEIDFKINGAELEIDKRILEELKDPLIHLIRNSIDHGIGKPQERILKNKPAGGKIRLDFSARENGQVEITLSDDGNGIDKAKLIKAALKKGLLSEEAAAILEPEECYNLIYQSGISTSSIITDISGHGLGLSIVREKVIKLNGKISVESDPGHGTTFRILLPMTLSTFRGIVVKVQEFAFILPTMNVERVMKIDREDIRTVENHETILVGDKVTSIVDLREVLGLPEKRNSVSDNMETENGISNQIRVVVLSAAELRIAFKVNDITDEQQVLVKPLGKLLKRVRNISGATILGSGKVVPVLNISDLMKTALRVHVKAKVSRDGDLSIRKTGKILVVEDSITSRTMLKNVLETSGYSVVTAFDGLDGFTKARDGEFDLILSDVDMPRVNGFELTTKIRADKKLKEMPVILLTALGSQADREHGIDVGADAYIIKSSFDQGNLLDIVKKLI